MTETTLPAPAAARITARLVAELQARPAQIEATVGLLDGGATVPFIARYRKEATGGLDDTQLRTLAERLTYLRELEERRAAVLASIRDQGKLEPALEAQIAAADTKTRLEDLYLPYKPRRRTKADAAREAGLAPLAEALLADPSVAPEARAEPFVAPDKGVADAKAALEGARHILVERFAEDADLIARLRRHLAEHGRVTSRLVEGKETEGAKFRDYFDMSEPLARVPSHRALAMLRGRNEGALTLSVTLADEAEKAHPCIAMIAAHAGIADRGRPGDRWLLDTASWAWKVRIALHLELDLLSELRTRAEDEAITVFARNLHDLLLAPPAGPRATMGLDPGIRTGVKVAIVNRTGKLLDTATIYPHAPRNDWDGSIATLAGLARRHGVDLVAIGNGTASRETDKLVGDLMRRHPELPLTKAMVSEAGASVYSASALAAAEFPELDVSLRGAVSIARRLQDPLAELVKIDPRSIGVGQYQHDVAQGKLARSLDAVVEDCVNAVGVDVNMASAPLLARVAGLSEGLARNIVAHRDQFGAFRTRRGLADVPRLGPKAFEQAAGFLRIMDGDEPLDASAVHPEAYPVVARISAKSGRPVPALIGDGAFLRGLSAADYTDERFGLPTVTDILAELEKPGRDPRPEFKAARFLDGVETLADLKPGMALDGVVTNVTAFGAFVDVGVHQDGLVHVSQLADRFVKDPHSVVKAGDIVRVRVVEVDLARKRIQLTMRSDAAPAEGSRAGGGRPDAGPRREPAAKPDAGPRREPAAKQARPSARNEPGCNETPRRPAAPTPAPPGAMAEAFARARKPRDD